MTDQQPPPTPPPPPGDSGPEFGPGSGKQSRREDALTVVRRLRDRGHVAYFAGGCVRDLLLGVEPKDYDVATDAPPARVRGMFGNTQAVGQAFGVILVRHGGSQIEVATFRADGRYLDGRRPEGVRFTTAEEDARRRDFTINGLFYDPIDDRVLDFVGGQKDLRDSVLRAIGNPDERFEEDHLRLLRAVRFAARFGLRVEPATATAIARHADALRRISPERIAEELRLMLTPTTRAAAWRMLWAYELIPIIMRLLPEPAPASPPGPLDEARSVFLALCPHSPVPFGLALAAAVLCYRRHAQGFPPDVLPMLAKKDVQEAAHATRQALKISNDESEEMADTLIGLAPLLSPGGEPSVATLKRFLARPTSAESRALLDALSAVGLHGDRADWLRRRLSELEQTDYAPEPLITGDDLAKAGLTPGPLFKRILDAVYDAQLEGRVRTREEAMEMGLGIAR